jgi:hypothetical protein
MRRTLTGATGLEPATSGVTGRYGLDRYRWLRPGIVSWSSASYRIEPALTGYDLPSPGRAYVARVWSPWLRIRQRSYRELPEHPVTMRVILKSGETQDVRVWLHANGTCQLAEY